MGNWIKNELCELNKDNLELLIAHKIPGIIVRNFVPDAICEEVARRFDRIQFETYDHLNDIPVHHIGLCHNQWAHDEKSVYFGKVEAAQQVVEQVFEGLDVDTVGRVVDALASKGERDVGVFEEPGYGRYFAGAFRSFKGHGRLHVDHAPSHISAPWAVTEIINQLTWNVYYSLRNEPGDLVIYDTIHTPENEKMKVAGDYYFPYEVLEGEGCVRVTPEVGDLIIFNTQNFHEILGHKEGTRISQTSFVGVGKEGELRLWS